jgi:hypothetical protein
MGQFFFYVENNKIIEQFKADFVSNVTAALLCFIHCVTNTVFATKWGNIVRGTQKL